LSPPIPDPAGITYLSSRDRLLISDSEVDEVSIYQGSNLFETTRAGVLTDRGVTTAYTKEAAGVGNNPGNGHIFVSDDDQFRVYEVVAGPDNGDPNAAPVPLRGLDHATLLQTRIGYFEDDGRVPVTADTRSAIQRTVQALRDQGFTVEPFVPEGLDEALRLWHALFIDGVAMVLRLQYRGREDDMHSIVREILRMSELDPPLTAESLLDVLVRRDIVRAKFLAQMERYPILVCPVSAIPAFRHGERSWTIGNKAVQYPDAFSYSQYFNLLGNPAAVVPMGRSAEGMPIGVQIVGRPWEEERVLAISRSVEQAGGWQGPPSE